MRLCFCHREPHPGLACARKKHKKPTQKNPDGAILDIYAPIDASNVALIDPKTKKATRAKIEFVTGKDKKVTKVRVTRDGKSKLD